MVKIPGSKCVPVIALCAGFWISACAASQSVDASAAGPGSARSILAAKQPGVFGPHLAAADAPAAAPGGQVMPGSSEAVLGSKMPGVYGPHLPAADAAPQQVAASTCQPGSFAAVMSAKLPPNARPGKPEIYKDCR